MPTGEAYPREAALGGDTLGVDEYLCADAVRAVLRHDEEVFDVGAVGDSRCDEGVCRACPAHHRVPHRNIIKPGYPVGEVSVLLLRKAFVMPSREPIGVDVGVEQEDFGMLKRSYLGS